MKTEIESSLKRHFDHRLAEELLAAYVQAKQNYYLGGLRLSAVEGGRFCEAAFRLLEQRTGKTFTPLGSSLDTDMLIRRLANIVQGEQPDSIRIHIPRALRVVYDIRNKRDAAHLADDIDPNLQDATLVGGILDWVMAEFVRLYHIVSPDEAQRIIGDLVSRQAPVVQELEGFLKILNPNLKAADRVLLLLYQRGAKQVSAAELRSWVHPKMVSNLNRTLYQMEHDRALIHSAGGVFQITDLGKLEVERRKLYEFQG